MGTDIEWTDETWNPIRARTWVCGLCDWHGVPAAQGKGGLVCGGCGAEGVITVKVGWHCEVISPGCCKPGKITCYANQRNKGFFQLGTGLPYILSSREKIELFLDEEVLMKPLRWRRPRRIFPCSMTDWAGEWVRDEWMDKMIAIAALCPDHTFQFLTKQADRMFAYFNRPGCHNEIELAADLILPGKGHPSFGGQHMLPKLPLPNVWLGVSVEDQERANERITKLLDTPAAVRFLSCEPLLGELDLGRYLDPLGFQCVDPDCVHRYRPFVDEAEYETTTDNDPICLDCGQVGTWTGYEKGLDLVIAGGESGHHARPSHVDYFRGLRDQCVSAGVNFFFKQHGEYLHESQIWKDPERVEGIINTEAEEFVMSVGDIYSIAHQHEDRSLSYRVGKNRTGRLLDGVEWNQMPGSIRDEQE